VPVIDRSIFDNHVCMCQWLVYVWCNQKPWQSIDTFFEILTFYKRLQEVREKQRIKENIIAQWINLHRYNSFVNRWWLPLLYETTGAIALTLLGHMAGWQADEIVINSEFPKLYSYWMKCLGFLGIQQRYNFIITVPMHFSRFYQVKSLLRWNFEHHFCLLLSTIIFNDI